MLRTLRGFASVLLCVCAASLAGCSTFVSNTDEEIVGRETKDELRFLISKAPAIMACVKHAGVDCSVARAQMADVGRNPRLKAAMLRALAGQSAAAEAQVLGINASSVQSLASRAKLGPLSAGQAYALNNAVDALSNETHIKLEVFYQQVAGEDDGNAQLGMTKDELRPYARSIQEATSHEGWAILNQRVGAMVTYLQGEKKLARLSAGEDSLLAVLEASGAQITLVEAYMRAYFLNFKLFDLTVDANNETAITAAVKKAFPLLSDSATKQLVAKLLARLTGKKPDASGKYHLVAKGTGGFVTRSGAKYAFPGISVTLDITSDEVVKASEVDFTQVGSDVVRVFWEATGDALTQLPADAGSTACELVKAGSTKNYPALRCYGSDPKLVEQVTEEQAVKVSDRAGKVETYTATATGQLIRGISWLSLNNEALAKLIETSVGVVARKATEKVTWCYYACTAKPPADTASFLDAMQPKKMSVRVADVERPVK